MSRKRASNIAARTKSVAPGSGLAAHRLATLLGGSRHFNVASWRHAVVSISSRSVDQDDAPSFDLGAADPISSASTSGLLFELPRLIAKERSISGGAYLYSLGGRPTVLESSYTSPPIS